MTHIHPLKSGGRVRYGNRHWHLKSEGAIWPLANIEEDADDEKGRVDPLHNEPT